MRGEPRREDGVGRDDQISTHSPRAGRTFQRSPLRGREDISTHSPRAGRTRRTSRARRRRRRFQLTRPVRGEPVALA